MSAGYPIVDVDPQWKTVPEAMGSKGKFWFRMPGPPSGPDWLFKFPVENTGGHWRKKSPTKSPARCASSRPRLSWRSAA